MPRSPAELPPGVRITDKMTLGTFARIFPVEMVKAALDRADKATERTRDMPNHFVVYFAMMLALFRESSAREVLRCVFEGLEWLSGRPVEKVTGRSGISQARSRVSWEPLKFLFESVAKPLSARGQAGCFFQKWRIVALDSSLFCVGDTEENRQAFGVPGNSQEPNGAYPQTRLTALVECGTHAIFDIAIGSLHDSEKTLAEGLVTKLQPDMICLADRGFTGYKLFAMASATGAALLWRVRKDVQLVPEKLFSDGSYLARIYCHTDRTRTNPITVRVIEYEVKGAERKEVIRLLTNILDPRSARALDLAELYGQRWEYETMMDEMKVHLGLSSLTLRSKTPDLVKQELYGLVMAHYCIRTVMHEAAAQAGIDDDSLSFTHSLRVIRRRLPMFGAFPPGADPSHNTERDLAGAGLL